MRIAFMGTPDFAVPALKALYQAGHEIAAVYTQPPRPAGRGQAMRPSSVQITAQELGLPLRTPVQLRGDTEAQAEFTALGLEAAVVAAYGLILPRPMLNAPTRGCLNIHASLLPRWRGAAPIQAAILAGDPETGITIMQMEAGLDTGPILLKRSTPITRETTAARLHDELATLGARLILDALASPPHPAPQTEADSTYAPKLSRASGRIDWSQSAEAIDRQVRAFDPWPGTFTTLDGSPLKVLAVKPAEGSATPGTVLDGALTVACGSGAIRLTRVQLAGRGGLNVDTFLRGHPIAPGTVLGQ